MNNTSTPTGNSHSTLSMQENRQPKPTLRTLSFVRQFARVYQSSRLNIPALPGIILN